MGKLVELMGGLEFLQEFMNEVWYALLKAEYMFYPAPGQCNDSMAGSESSDEPTSFGIAVVMPSDQGIRLLMGYCAGLESKGRAAFCSSDCLRSVKAITT